MEPMDGDAVRILSSDSYVETGFIASTHVPPTGPAEYNIFVLKSGEFIETPDDPSTPGADPHSKKNAHVEWQLGALHYPPPPPHTRAFLLIKAGEATPENEQALRDLANNGNPVV